MRTFWINYKVKVSTKGSQIDIEGDVVADMPDDGKLTSAWLNHIRAEVQANVIAKLSEIHKVDPSAVGTPIILSVIPLEG
jgi:hypothetical protein